MNDTFKSVCYKANNHTATVIFLGCKTGQLTSSFYCCCGVKTLNVYFITIIFIYKLDFHHIMTNLTLQLDHELHYKFKKKCLFNQVTMSKVVISSIENYVNDKKDICKK